MGLRYSTALRNARLDALALYMGPNAILRLYDGARPPTGGAATNLLSEHTFQGAAAPAANGVLALPLLSISTVMASGTATWFRIVRANGYTHVLDGDVSTFADSTGDVQLSPTALCRFGTLGFVETPRFSEGNA